jgi:hypothetical protein
VSDPAEPRRLHPLSPVLDGARILPQLVFLFVLGGAGGLVTLPLLVVGGLAVLILRYVSWARTTYQVEGRRPSSWRRACSTGPAPSCPSTASSRSTSSASCATR